MAISLSSSAQDAFSTKKLARAVNNNAQNDDNNCGKRVHIKERRSDNHRKSDTFNQSENSPSYILKTFEKPIILTFKSL